MKPSSRPLYQLFCFIALIVAVVYPVWAQIQQTRAYYGYADIRLSPVGAPANVVAGGMLTLPVQIFNRGPNVADSPKVVFSIDSTQLTGISTQGCLESPVPLTRCSLMALDLNVGKDVAQTWLVHPSARGNVVIGAFGLSEANDPVPGNEQVVTVTRINTAVNLQTTRLSQYPQTIAGGRLRWEFQVVNSGLSDALAITASTSGTPSLSVRCLSSSGNASCGSNPSSGFSGTNNGILRYELITPSLVDVPNQVVTFTAMPNLETEINPTDNSVTVTWMDALFQNSFE
jgi:hypothetical protein